MKPITMHCIPRNLRVLTVTVLGLFLFTAHSAFAAPLWTGDMEEGNLNDWTLNGGGEFNNGNGDSIASQDRAHSGTWSAKMTISNDGSTASDGTRLFRWAEPRANPNLYYSTWFYLPQTYTVNGWVNWVQWKSRTATKNDPFWFLDVRNRADGSMYFLLTWWNRLAIEGPHQGESGGRTYASPINIPVGRWFQLEARYICDGNFNGRVIIWQDGVQIFDQTNVRTRYSDGNCEWAINNYGHNISPRPTVMYADDAQISQTRIGTPAPSP